MCWDNWTHGFYYPFAQGSSRFSWWEAMKREVKMARIQDTTSISMPGLERGARNRQVRIWLLCLTPIFSVLFLPTIFLLFLVLQYACKHVFSPDGCLEGLRTEANHWRLTSHRERQCSHRRHASVVLKINFTSSNKQQEGSHRSSFFPNLNTCATSDTVMS